MVEHPQISGLLRKKAELIEKSDSLRAEIAAEAAPLVRTAAWISLGINAAQIFITRKHWIYSLLGLATACACRSKKKQKKIETAEQNEQTPGRFKKLASLASKIIACWKLIQKIQKFLKKKQEARSKKPE